jgi:hypothetical protein
MAGPLQEKAAEVIHAQISGNDRVLTVPPFEEVPDISPTRCAGRPGGTARLIEVRIELIELAPDLE